MDTDRFKGFFGSIPPEFDGNPQAALEARQQMWSDFALATDRAVYTAHDKTRAMKDAPGSQALSLRLRKETSHRVDFAVSMYEDESSRLIAGFGKGRSISGNIWLVYDDVASSKLHTVGLIRARSTENGYLRSLSLANYSQGYSFDEWTNLNVVLQNRKQFENATLVLNDFAETLNQLTQPAVETVSLS